MSRSMSVSVGCSSRSVRAIWRIRVCRQGRWAGPVRLDPGEASKPRDWDEIGCRVLTLTERLQAAVVPGPVAAFCRGSLERAGGKTGRERCRTGGKWQDSRGEACGSSRHARRCSPLADPGAAGRFDARVRAGGSGGAGWTRACRQQEAPRRLAGSEEEARGMGMRAGGRCDNAKGRAQAAGKLLLLASRLLSIASAAIPSIASVSRFPENECHRGRSIWDMSGDVENLARSLRGRRRVCAV